MKKSKKELAGEVKLWRRWALLSTLLFDVALIAITIITIPTVEAPCEYKEYNLYVPYIVGDNENPVTVIIDNKVVAIIERGGALNTEPYTRSCRFGVNGEVWICSGLIANQEIGNRESAISMEPNTPLIAGENVEIVDGTIELTTTWVRR